MTIDYEPSEWRLIRIRSDWSGNWRCMWLDITPHENLEHAYELLNWDDSFEYPHLDHPRVGEVEGGPLEYSDVPF